VLIQLQDLYLHTIQRKHRTSMSLLGIRTHDPSVRASEDSSCLRPRGYCARTLYFIIISIFCTRVHRLWQQPVCVQSVVKKKLPLCTVGSKINPKIFPGYGNFVYVLRASPYVFYIYVLTKTCEHI
jgi:hypothetical protein